MLCIDYLVNIVILVCLRLIALMTFSMREKKKKIVGASHPAVMKQETVWYHVNNIPITQFIHCCIGLIEGIAGLALSFAEDHTFISR